MAYLSISFSDFGRADKVSPKAGVQSFMYAWYLFMIDLGLNSLIITNGISYLKETFSPHSSIIVLHAATML